MGKMLEVLLQIPASGCVTWCALEPHNHLLNKGIPRQEQLPPVCCMCTTGFAGCSNSSRQVNEAESDLYTAPVPPADSFLRVLSFLHLTSGQKGTAS